MSPGELATAVIRRHHLDIDPDVVHRLLNEGLDDFVLFARSVSRYLDARKLR